MARQYQTSRGFACETGTRQYQSADAFVSETVSTGPVDNLDWFAHRNVFEDLIEEISVPLLVVSNTGASGSGGGPGGGNE